MRSGCTMVTMCVLAWLSVAPAHAADSWSDPMPGVRHLSRTTSNAGGAQRIHAAIVDLSRPELYLRATRPDEAGRTTTSYANLVGAAVAINGDWHTGTTTHGLAVGNGVHWPGSADVDWSFIACTVEKTCEIDTSYSNRELYWRWYDVVGGNNVLLVVGGNVITNTDAFYAVDRHPRSAIGLSADKQTMIFTVVQGRRGDSAGMTFNEMAQLMKELGAHDAMMLDGGGSSALVIGGARVNDLPTGTGERSVANHFAVVRRANPDGRCQVANGRWCVDGTVIGTCQGGGAYADGDCGAFGASCEETAGVGHCTDYRCARGGSGTYCFDQSWIATCDLGRYSEGDCAFFGASCEDNGTAGYCVHPYCVHGGNATWCLDTARIATCTNGAFSEGDCSVFGASCEENGGAGYCVHPLCTEGGNATWCPGPDRSATCTQGQFAEALCAAGEACSDALGRCVAEACVGREDVAWCDGEVAHRCTDGVETVIDCVAQELQCTAGVCSNTRPEVCAGGVDEDGDGAIDCADSDCAAASECGAGDVEEGGGAPDASLVDAPSAGPGDHEVDVIAPDAQRTVDAACACALSARSQVPGACAVAVLLLALGLRRRRA